MIRQYKIHTDLDGSNNKVFDMNNGKIRFYQPSDLGITTTTNIWKSDGVGIFGNSQVNHPNLEFKLETFGDTLEENYSIFNEFINAILAKKFVTLEYTTSLGTFYADVKLSKVTKTEAYGFNGTFSEKVAFDTITAWYTYQQLKFTKFENGKFNENTKIHAHAEWQKFNLLTNSRIQTNNIYPWIANSSTLSVRKNGLTVSSSQVLKNSDTGAIQYDFPFVGGKSYTVSCYVLNNSQTPINSFKLQFRFESPTGSTYPNKIFENSVSSGVLTKFEFTAIAPQNATKASAYFLARSIADNSSFNFDITDMKVEENEVATPWLPLKNEGFDVVGRYTYSNTSYVYSNEENIDRFSKWLIEENIFSFVARLTPSKNVENKKYGLRFLNSDANEYSAIVFSLPQVADVIQINTDSNDEYYQAIFNGQAVNMFSALDFQRFRTRLFEKGSMELIGLDSVEMNVKRKVDFV